MTAAIRDWTFAAPDGERLAVHEAGPADGRLLVLLHGLFSNATVNWIKYGHAARLADAGIRVVMPDLRAHGDSARPHDAAAYPPDVLAADAEALLGHLGAGDGDYDLGGYSLGARTAIRMVIRGARPRRLVVAGMGVDGMLDTGRRAAHFRRVLTGLGTHERLSGAWMAEQFLKTTGGDPEALLPLLGSFVDSDRSELAAVTMPTLVVAGVDDDDNGSAQALAEALPDATYRDIPGNHMNAVTNAELGEAIADFLTA